MTYGIALKILTIKKKISRLLVLFSVKINITVYRIYIVGFYLQTAAGGGVG